MKEVGTDSMIELDGNRIGDSQPCYFMAEVGGNYGTAQDIDRIVGAASAIGLNAIKFQTFKADTITAPGNMFDLETTGHISQHDFFRAYEPSEDLQSYLFDRAARAGVTAFSAPSHVKDLEFLEALGVPAYKIGSDLACHIPLLEVIAQTRKPIVLSTGMATYEEISISLEHIFRYHQNVVLMHCVSDYPTHAENVNLNNIAAMKEKFGVPVGFSDHTAGMHISLAAVALGANAIERHFWVQGNQPGPDMPICSDEHQFGDLIFAARQIEQALGSTERKLSPQERINRVANRVGIVCFADVAAGQTIGPDVVDIRRPGGGIEPRYWESTLGRKARYALAAGHPLQWDDLESDDG